MDISSNRCESFIHLAFTNPCFEYWVAMHHPEFDGRIPLNEERVLKEKKTVEACGTYRKREVIERIYELCASPDDALSLAKKFFPGYEKMATAIFVFSAPRPKRHASACAPCLRPRKAWDRTCLCSLTGSFS
ncbi:MAG: hypothetical protein EGQ34_01105 [Sutterella sp.]|nr:hypothetical protein [Sutterella sp.]